MPASTGPDRSTQRAKSAVRRKRRRAAIPTGSTPGKRNEKPAPRGRGGWEEGRSRRPAGTGRRGAVYSGSLTAANNRGRQGGRGGGPGYIGSTTCKQFPEFR